MKSISFFKQGLFLIVALPVIAHSQSALKGTVVDAVTNETLIGVNVVIEGTSLGAATDIEGQFRIAGIPERPSKIKVSCVGYEQKIIEIDFSKSRDITTTIQLKATVLEGEEVVVTAQMRGQIAAINQQITSNTIINVVSEEKIKELPDANAAEAIGRLPGVSIIRSGGEASKVVLRGLSSKFSNITIDGVKIPPTDHNTRDVDLSTISQGSLAGIELIKAITPDQDADAIAGAVNLVTRKAPSEREIRVDIKGDYNYLMKSAKQYEFAARYGERFFDDILGVQLQATAEKKIRSKEHVAYSYGTFDNSTLSNWGTFDPNIYDNDYLINRFTVNFTDEDRKRNGVQAIFDVNTPDNGVIKIKGIYEGTNRNMMLYNRVYPAPYGTFDYNYRYTEQGIHTTNSAVQGKNYILWLTVDWGVSYAHSKTDNPYEYAMKFTETPGGTYTPTKVDPDKYIIPYANNRFLEAQLYSSMFYKQENFDRERTANLDVTQKFTIGNLFTNEVKIGGKYKEKLRWMNRSELIANNYLISFSQYSTNADGSPIILTGTRFEDYLTSGRANLVSPSLSDFVDPPAVTRDLLGRYRMMPLIDKSTMQLWYALNKNAVSGAERAYTYSIISVLDNYDVIERISSAYIMNTLNIGQSATLMLGIRVEKEVNDYTTKLTPGGISVIGVKVVGEIKDTIDVYSETFILPNAQLTLRPTDFLTFRLAAYRALARPDYNLRLPKFGYVSLGMGTIPLYDIGNPNLRNAKAWNFEANTQVYSNTIGLFTVSAFYKIIDDMFNRTNRIELKWINDPSTSRYYVLDSLLDAIGTTWRHDKNFQKLLHVGSRCNLSMAYNSSLPTYAWGVEFEHQMNFGFLPISWLRNITLSYNFSITRSKSSIILTKMTKDSVWVTGRQPRWIKEDVQVPIIVTRVSEDQPEIYGNVALGYDIAGFSARLSLFYQDRYTRAYSDDGTSDDIVNSFSKVDLVLKQQITSNISLFLSINNLTNMQDRTSRINNIMNWNLPQTAELYGTTATFGARLSL